MSLNELLQIGGGLLLLVTAIAVLVGNIYYVIRSKTNKIQKEEIEQLKKDFAGCEAKHVESQKDIHRLEGQLEASRNIPLIEIKDGIKSIAITNGKILDRLDSSAITLKQDTKDAKTAVRTVKADLEVA